MKVGRLALRVEGEWWVAYWAPRQQDMRGAVMLGTIRMSVVGPPGAPVYEGFVELMRVAFGNMVEDVTGRQPSWGGLEPAPESERSGRA